MSQHDLNVANASRSTVRADINGALAALGTLQKGSSAPSGPSAGWLWLDDDTPSSTKWTLKQYDGTDWIAIAYIDTVANTWTPASAVAPLASVGFIGGWTWQNNGSDPSNDIDIAAGRGIDTTGAASIVGGAMTKRLDAAWSAGTGNGGRQGTLADGEWFVHAVLDVTNQLVDYIFSQSYAAPTLPSGYTLFRPIGWFRRESGVNLGFVTYELPGGGIELLWKAPTLDISVTALGTTFRTDVLKVPTSFSTVATINALISDAATAGLVWVYCPDQTAAAPSDSAAPLANLGLITGAGIFFQGQLRIRTDATGKIAAVANFDTVDVYKASTIGFEWSRR